MSGAQRGVVAFVNNSRESFTPTVSGAIATCVFEVGQVAMAEGYDCPVITRPADAAAHSWLDLHVTRPMPRPGRVRAKAQRVRRRLNGWARPDQWAYAHDALAELRRLRPQAVIVNNDPEIAVFLRRRLPSVRVVHWFHNLEMASDRFRRRFAADRGIRSVAVSAYLARAVEQVYRLTPLSVSAALNGVDLERFDAGRTAKAPTVPTVGFVGRLAIHPAQVPVINDVFKPTDAQIAKAKAVVAAFAAKPGAGTVGIDGKMYDRPHLVRAKALLESLKARS